ncbi:hypothetical protein PFTANZ_01662, partial [Plasmodium falciparum Tanzania (2000708)]
MAPPVRPSSSGGGTQEQKDKYKFVDDAKDLLDRIGEDIYKKAKKDANDFREKLKGTLSEATYPNDKRPERTTPKDPCELEYQWHTNVTSTEIEPCKHKSGKRLSEVHNSECDRKKIKDSEKDSEGACAPFRRLHVCDKNLEQIDPDKIESTHNLLVDVCMAAKFEGQSIRGYHPQYDATYPGSGSTMCTMLARSFADIGDIIRGKDLYIGNKGKREKLEEKLKQYFKKIYGKLKDAQNHYSDTTNYYELREHWWNANRQEIWKALTCDAPNGDVHYFRKTCSNDTSHTKDKCRCPKGDQVPTYFDYVPQFLRWFEEWAEDFCRKRKKKIENAIRNCRGDSGRDKYCDLNGYDCTKTARGKNKRFSNDECYKCSLPCDHFVPWIDNQQKEFEKQKNKYAEEINKTHDTTLRVGATTINNLYVKEFYEQLRENYGKVEEFLEILSKEGICQSKPNVGNETADAADFTKNKTEETFSRTKYCRACPWCGLKYNKDGTWERLDDISICANEKKTYEKKNITEIPVLTPDKSQSRILDKYKNFCNSSDGKNDDQIKKWKCYYEKNDEDDGNGDSNMCVLQKDKQNTEEENDRSYNSFFWKWVTEMLIDSIDWRKELKRCINNESKPCKNGCKNNCDCFQRWIDKKKSEWGKIKDHFGKQEDMRVQIGEHTDPGIILEGVLKVEDILTNIKDGYKEVKGAEHIEELLDEEKQKSQAEAADGGTDNKNKTTIDKLLKHEGDEAKKCKKCKDPQKPQQNPSSVARSAETHDDTPHAGSGDQDDDDDEEEEVQEEEVCEIVDGILNGINGTKQVGECNPKDQGSSYPDWDCEKNIDISHYGACMPPRRQKLCLYYIAHESQTKNIITDEKLREAFIKTAAAETFLSWQYYKTNYDSTNDLDEKLQKGQIPPEFLRSMYYTYGDYRDICLDTDISSKIPDDDVNKAKRKITAVFQKISRKTTDTDKGLTRKWWWNENGPKIWEGMLCALSYDKTHKNMIEHVRPQLNSTYNYNSIKDELEDFASRPQFLRWFTEWGDQFCRERVVKIEELKNGCTGYECNNLNNEDQKKKCAEACVTYQKFIKKWKTEYERQREKFKKDKDGKKYKDYPSTERDIEKATDAHEYLHIQLEKLCGHGNCDCMKEVSKVISPEKVQSKPQKKTQEQSKSFEGNDMPASLDEVPSGYKHKCKCPDPPRSACDIVKELFEDNSEKKKYFDDACSLKYSHGKEKHTQWKCINDTTSSPSGKETTSSTSTCIPPRRQKLYLKKIEELTSGGTPHELRKAFIECAAIETFFLWDRYKKIKLKEKQEERQRQNGEHLLSHNQEGSQEDEVQNKLNDGTIPDDFLRQMFYTLGDYRDICVGVKEDVIKALEASGDKNIETINKKIKTILNGATSSRTRGQQPSDNDPKTWWEKNGKDIWHGMICALTYEDNGEKGEKHTLKQNKSLKEALWDEKKKKPTDNYTYENVKLEEENSGEKTRLSEFVLRPPYFRYLEEWGETFCRQRTRMLKDIIYECRNRDRGGHKYCSGDGYDCEKIKPENYENISDLDCRDCHIQCRKYRKWIDIKFVEYHKQKDKYDGEFQKLEHKSSGDKKLEGYKCAENFLKSLRHCKDDQTDGEKEEDYDKNKINFENIRQTFSPSTYCKACPLNGVTCSHRGGCKAKSIIEKNTIEGETFNIPILLNDGATNDTDQDLEQNCTTYGLYKDLRKQEWKCQYLNGVDQCNINKDVESKYFDNKIPFNVLFERWINDFIQYYNKSKANIRSCIKNEDRTDHICIKGCKNKCECVEKWIEKKENEWEKIKEHYNKQTERYTYNVPYK